MIVLVFFLKQMLWCDRGGVALPWKLTSSSYLQVLFKHQEKRHVRSYDEMFIPVEFLPAAALCSYV